MKSSVKFSALFSCIIFLSLFVFGCAGTANKIVGVSMPSKDEPRWIQDGENIVRQLQAKGYEVDMQNAEANAELQISQIEAMIEKNCSVLVIVAHDGSSLTEVLQKAVDKKIKIIAYDRLIMDTPNVDYYVTFNNFDVGVMQGDYIETALNLKDTDGPYNIEIFAGSPKDNNSKFFYNGAMSILQPYIDSGKLVVRSGQSGFDETAIMDWEYAAAQQRMSGLLQNYYSDGTELHAILSPNDGLAMGIINALKEIGYGKDKPFPIITGQDCVPSNVVAMINGEQSMSVFKDTRSLASKTVEMIDDIVVRKKAATNDSKTYDNGVKIVPTYICSPIFADKDNYKRILIDSGYYDESDLGIG